MTTKRKRWVVGAVSAGLLVAAIVLAGVSWSWSSVAHRARADATALRAEARRQRAGAAHADEQRHAIDAAVRAVRERFVAFGAAMDADTDAHNRVIDVHDAAADLFNRGRLAASADGFRSEGEPAVAAEAAATAAVHDALKALQGAVTNLEGVTK
jgi:hypothetical protein